VSTPVPAYAGLGPRQAAVIAYLAEHPGLTAGELARAFGLRSLYKQLARLEGMARIVSVPVWDPDQGRQVARWHVAPPAPVPPPVPPADPDQVRRRRDRDAAAQRARRARLRGPVWPARFTSLPGAACRTADPGLFFPPDRYEDPPARRRRERQAKAFCDGCPARRRCFELAEARGEPWGIWGGTDFGELRRERRRRAS
jgi:WhiB family transcriptional regulator, redox-sensing transcriptional regulator